MPTLFRIFGFLLRILKKVQRYNFFLYKITFLKKKFFFFEKVIVGCFL